MPKITADRIVNLKYNDGNRIIDDLVWEVNGEQSLNMMDNGGGKSVINQMMMAPFLFGNDRNYIAKTDNSSKNEVRRFASFFMKNTKPTYLIKEFLKDSGSGRFMMTMMISPVNESESKPDAEDDVEFTSTNKNNENLRIHVWIEESEDPDNSMIRINPFKDEKGVWSWDKTIQYFESKRKSGANIASFDLTKSGAETKLRRKMESLGIDHLEKKNMRKFAMVESGLATFVESNNSEEALMNNWIIPTAAMRIDENGTSSSPLTEVKQGIENYIHERETNEETLHLYSCYEHYLNFYSGLEKPAQEILSIQQILDQANTEKTAAGNALQFQLQEQKSEIEQNESLLNDFNQELTRIHLEKDSVAYHRFMDQALAYQTELNAFQKEKNFLNQEKQEQTLQLSRLNYTLLHNEIHALKSKLQEYEAEKKILTSKTNELKQEIDRYGAGLHFAYTQQLEALTDQKEELEEQLFSTKQNLNHLDQSLNENLKTITQLEDQITSSKRLIRQYEQLEAETCEKWKCIFNHSIMPFQYENKITTLIQNCEDRLNQNKTALQSNEDTLQKDTENQLKCGEKLKKVRQHINELNTVYAGQLTQKETFETAHDKWNEIAERYLEEDIYRPHDWNTSWLIDQLNQLNQATDENLQIKRTEESRIRNLLTQLSKEGGTLDPDIHRLMESMDIQIKTGADYLRNMHHVNHEQKIEACKKWPLLPYSLIMTSDEKSRLMNELKKRDIKTENLLVMTDFDTTRLLMLNTLESLHPEKAAELDNTTRLIYANFNLDLLDPEILAQKRQELKQSLNLIQSEIMELNQCQQARYAAIGQLDQNKSLTPSAFELLLKDLQKTESALETEKGQEIRIQNNIDSLSNSIQNRTRELERLRNQKFLLNSELQDLQHLHEQYKTAADAYYEMEQLENELQTAEQQTDALKQEQNKQRQLSDELIHQKSTCQSEQNRIKKEKREFEGYIPAKELPGLSLDEMKSHFIILSSDHTSKDLHQLILQISTTTDTITKKEAIEQDFPESIQTLPLLENADESMRSTIQNLIQSIEKKLEQTQKRIDAKAADHIRQETKAENQRNSILTKYQQEPLGKDQLEENKNYTHVIQQLNNDIQELNAELKRCSEQMSILRDVYARLEGEGIQTDREVSPVLQNTWNKKSLDTIKTDLSSIRTTITTTRVQIRNKARALKDKIESYLSSYHTSLDLMPEHFKNLLLDMQYYTDQPETFLENHQNSLNIIRDYMADALMKKEQDDQLKQQKARLIVEYARRIHDEIRKIDSSTNVNFRGTTRKLLTINQHEQGSSEVLLNFAERYIDNLYKEYKIYRNTDKRNSFFNRINAASLYTAVYGSSNTEIYILKPEIMTCRKKRWRTINSEQSGAERLFASSVVLCSLLYYQRNGAKAGRQGSRKWTTMYLDNMFANIQSDFILIPLFELFTATCTQIITFSNIPLHQIIAPFDRIQLLKLHKKGHKEYVAIHEKDEDNELQNVYKLNIAATRLSESSFLTKNDCLDEQTTL